MYIVHVLLYGYVKSTHRFCKNIELWSTVHIKCIIIIYIITDALYTYKYIIMIYIIMEKSSIWKQSKTDI